MLGKIRDTKQLIWLAAAFGLVIGLLTYKITYALYSDTASSINNTFSAAEEFPTPTPTDTPSTGSATLVINEVSSVGTSAAEWIELFNKSASPVDISGWKIKDSTSDIDTFPATSPIPAGGFVIVVTNNTIVGSIPVSAVTIHLLDGDIGSGLNNAGDQAFLLNQADLEIDSMNYGSTTTPFPAPPADPGAGETLKRGPNGVDTNSADDWITTNGNSIGAAN